jgi:uncharacterized protein (DUF2147 family)
MRSLKLVLPLASLLGLCAPALAAESAQGTWLVQDQSAKVRIAPCAGRPEALCGEIVWLKAPVDANGAPKRDVHNPDARLKTRPILGLTMIRDFRPAGPGEWDGGKIYDPRSGKTYNSKMRLTPQGELKVDGCVAIFCQTQTWRRAAG